MSSKILLFNGKMVDPFDLKREDIDIKVIAHSLALANRYTGHTTRPYSVAQHTVLLTKAVPRHLRKAAFIHDWVEHLISDLSRPVKSELPDYNAIELKVQRQIFDFVGEPFENLAAVAPYDLRICVDEMQQLMSNGWMYAPDVEPLGIDCTPWDWQEAEMNFLQAYRVLFHD